MEGESEKEREVNRESGGREVAGGPRSGVKEGLCPLDPHFV